MLKMHKNDFNTWLSGRIRAASTGQILDHALGEYINVATAPSRVFLEHTQRKGDYNRKENPSIIEGKALDQAKASNSDPFIYGRTKTHLQKGICDLEDYGVEWQRVTVDLLDFNDKVVGRTMREMAMKVRRA